MTVVDADVVVADGREYRRRSFDGAGGLDALSRWLRETGPGRWDIGEPAWFRTGQRGEHAERIALWESEGRPVAWTWVRRGETGDALDLRLDTGHPALAAEALRWFAEAAAPGARSVTVLDAEGGLLDTVRAHGYRERPEGSYLVHLRRGLRDLPTPQVAEGYWLRHSRGDLDAEARAAVHRAAFSGEAAGAAGAAVTAEDYRELMRRGPYRAELDWLAGRTADGRPAAFCLAWLDEAGRAVVIDPVGTDPEHRRRGLARAAMLAALHHGRRLGAETAWVCVPGDADRPSARAVCEALGFRPFACSRTFTSAG